MQYYFEVDIYVYMMVIVFEVQVNISLLFYVKNIIVVVSGKGGVGKLMVFINLVLGLKVQGVWVGLFDVDLYGFLILIMFGLQG